MASHTQPPQSSSFIDQLLAGQLFVAARAHDALSEEVSNFLPPSISNIFPRDSDHSRKYKTAAYSALVKSQHHIEEDDNDSVTNDVTGNVVLHVLRNSLLQKVVSSYLTMNDKLSLIFAVSDDADDDEDELKEEAGSDDEDRSKKGGLSLSEDLFHRESEDLDFHRKQYLQQLVLTREAESKLQNVKQKLDRTRNLLNHPRSADLLRLNYLASKLFLLRDITSKNYEDYFTARGNYTTWSLEHQSRYTTATNQALDQARVAVETLHQQHQESILNCRQLMNDAIVGEAGKSGSVNKAKKKDVAAVQPKSKSRRRASVVVVAKDGVQLRTTKEVNEFHDMRRVGLTYLLPYREKGDKGCEELPEGGVIEEKAGGENDEDAPDFGIDINIDKDSDHGSDMDIETDKPSADVSVDGDSASKIPFASVAAPAVEKVSESPADEVEIEVETALKKEYVVDMVDLEAYRQRVAASLKEFEEELCERLESVSQKAVASVKKKFVSFELSDDLPLYLRDMKWKIDQKRRLVNTGANQIQATKETLAEDFERRIEKSYGVFLEQQMTKLKRVQSYCHVESSL
mmetsp:Transcript_8333/g.14121  ORF Transcript_8333/g.14121 Transcript_8333/m.14121 type:complete len:573 (+) Transcript_8333:40-1758(+)